MKLVLKSALIVALLMNFGAEAARAELPTVAGDLIAEDHAILTAYYSTDSDLTAYRRTDFTMYKGILANWQDKLKKSKLDQSKKGIALTRYYRGQVVTYNAMVMNSVMDICKTWNADLTALLADAVATTPASHDSAKLAQRKLDKKLGPDFKFSNTQYNYECSAIRMNVIAEQESELGK